ncbi:MAG: hypothetical protein L0Y64_13990, partial [Myxococcaceae bacterium]|nr:hypothetical protein [Myxococcaceae bacterium]
CTDASRDQALTLSMRVSECPTADTTASSTTVLDRVVREGCVTSSTGVLQCTGQTLKADDGFVDWRTSIVSSQTPHRFYQVHSFGGGPANRVFNDATGATAFDTARLSESDLHSLGTVSTPSASLASDSDEGWYMGYDAMDERTASAATIIQGFDGVRLCAAWNTLRPGSSGPLCGGAGSQTSRLIQGELLSGDDTCLMSFGVDTRYQARNVLVPPTSPTKVVAIGQGKVVTGMVLAEPGADPLMVRGNVQRDLMQASYHLELSPQEHVCRHSQEVAACVP